MILPFALLAYFSISAALAWSLRHEMRGSDVLGWVLALFVLPILFVGVQVHNAACHMRRRRVAGRPL